MFNDEPEGELCVNELEGKPHLSNDQEQTNSQPADDDNILQNDIQWGRKTLRKLLTNLGFLKQ